MKLCETIILIKIYEFCHLYSIINFRQTGKKSLSTAQTSINDMYFPYHLSTLRRYCDEGLHESPTEIFYESHIVIDMDNS